MDSYGMPDGLTEKVEEFYLFLQNKGLPEGMKIPEEEMPKLTEDQAFEVVWFLQEHLHVLPDNIEQCRGCKELYNSDSEGYCLDDHYELLDNAGELLCETLPKEHYGSWCDNCVPDVNFQVK